jgi:multimeric flavodoxin WrbA
MKNKTVIILGSSRSHGNTRKVIDELLSIKSDIDILDLNEYNIGYFDYGFKNKDDDFFTLIQKVLEYETIVFATPIYWYTMSAQIKTFLDRISDLLYEGKKEIGRQLRGKNMAVISCGSDDEIIEGFIMPFKESANYLGMTFKEHIHTWLNDNLKLPDKILKELEMFSEII